VNNLQKVQEFHISALQTGKAIWVEMLKKERKRHQGCIWKIPNLVKGEKQKQ